MIDRNGSAPVFVITQSISKMTKIPWKMHVLCGSENSKSLGTLQLCVVFSVLPPPPFQKEVSLSILLYFQFIYHVSMPHRSLTLWSQNYLIYQHIYKLHAYTYIYIFTIMLDMSCLFFPKRRHQKRRDSCYPW